MAYSLIFYFPDASTFNATNLIQSKLQIEESCHNSRWESDKNTLQLDLVYSSTLYGKIKTANGSIRAEVKDGSTFLFNGLLQPIQNLPFTNTISSISIELRDLGQNLEYTVDSAKVYTNQTLSYILNDLLTGTGITANTYPTRFTTKNVLRLVVDNTKTVWDHLKGLLYASGFSFYFEPNGTLSITDTFANISSFPLTVGDASNNIFENVDFKEDKTEATTIKINYETVGTQLANLNHQFMDTSDYPADLYNGNFSASWVSGLRAKYGSDWWRIKNRTGSIQPLLTGERFDYSSPKISGRFLGADNLQIYAYFQLYKSGSTNLVSGYGVFNESGFQYGTLYWNQHANNRTLTASDFTFVLRKYASYCEIELSFNDPTWNTVPYGGCDIDINGAAYFSRTGGYVKISNGKAKETSTSLEYLNNRTDAGALANFLDDVAKKRNWTASFKSYTKYNLGTGININLTSKGVSLQGGIFTRKTDHDLKQGVPVYSYDVVSYSDITITSVADPVVLTTPYSAQQVSMTGTENAPIIGNNISPVDLGTINSSGLLFLNTEFGYYDNTLLDYKFKVDNKGNFRLGLLSGNNLVYNPSTGDLTLTGAVNASSGNFTGVVNASNITATAGTIAGWILSTDTLKSATTGARIELNKTKSRISVFDGSGTEKVAMGYLEGLINPADGLPLSASTYGFWAKAGDSINFKADVAFSGSQILNDTSLVINDSSSNPILRMGTDTGEKGFFIYNTSGTKLTKINSGSYNIYKPSDGTGVFSLMYNSGSNNVQYASAVNTYIDVSGTGNKLFFSTGGTSGLGSSPERMWIDGGNVKIGVSSANDAGFNSSMLLEVQSSIGITQQAGFSQIFLNRMNGTARNTVSGILSGDEIGRINFGGTYDTNPLNRTDGGYIRAVAHNANWSSTARPTRLEFYVAGATGSPVGVLQISSTDIIPQTKITINNAGGMDISGTTLNIKTSGKIILDSTSDIYSDDLTDYTAGAGVVGWSTFTTKSVKYKKVGKIVFVWYVLEGTSNSTTTSFALPYVPSVESVHVAGRAQNNTTAIAGPYGVASTAGTVSFFLNNAGAWTASGTKKISGHFIYQV